MSGAADESSARRTSLNTCNQSGLVDAPRPSKMPRRSLSQLTESGECCYDGRHHRRSLTTTESLTLKGQRRMVSAAAKCSNRTARHRLHMTVKVLWLASTTSIDRVAPRW